MLGTYLGPLKWQVAALAALLLTGTGLNLLLPQLLVRERDGRGETGVRIVVVMVNAEASRSKTRRLVGCLCLAVDRSPGRPNPTQPIPTNPNPTQAATEIGRAHV